MKRLARARAALAVNLAASTRTALVVGTILTYLNTRGLSNGRELGWPLLVRYAMNCLVPFSVSVYSQWSMSRRLRALAESPSTAREPL